MLKLLSVLKPIEADILRKRFGLVNDRERTLKEIGDEYRLSRERVRQLQEQALGKDAQGNGQARDALVAWGGRRLCRRGTSREAG